MWPDLALWSTAQQVEYFVEHGLKSKVHSLKAGCRGESHLFQFTEAGSEKHGRRCIAHGLEERWVGQSQVQEVNGVLATTALIPKKMGRCKTESDYLLIILDIHSFEKSRKTICLIFEVIIIIDFM